MCFGLLKIYIGDRIFLVLGVIESIKLFNGKVDNYIVGDSFLDRK